MHASAAATLDADTQADTVSPEASDALLVELVRQGDPDAYGPLVARYEAKLRRIAWRFLHDHALAEDAAQDAFLKAYRQLGDFDASRRFGPWLFRIAVNLCLDLLRKQKRRGRPMRWESAGDPADPGPAVSAEIERDELRRQVRRVVDGLPLKYRTVLVLRDLEGFTCSEVAAIVHSPEATVRWRLSRARQLFRQRWEQCSGEHEEPRLGEPDAEPLDGSR